MFLEFLGTLYWLVSICKQLISALWFNFSLKENRSWNLSLQDLSDYVSFGSVSFWLHVAMKCLSDYASFDEVSGWLDVSWLSVTIPSWKSLIRGIQWQTHKINKIAFSTIISPKTWHILHSLYLLWVFWWCLIFWYYLDGSDYTFWNLFCSFLPDTWRNTLTLITSYNK